MTNVRPEVGRYHGFDHVHFYVSNAKQVASWYVLRFGFQYVAYRGLETGSRDVATWVVRQNKILLAFSSPLNPVDNALSRQIAITGDSVKDVAFSVSDAAGIHRKAVSRGAQSIQEPTELKDEYGSVVVATVRTYGDTWHTFVERTNYTGPFLPGFKPVNMPDPLSALAAPPNLLFIDHVVGNQPDLKMQEACEFYERCLDFHRFWSVDDTQMHTEFSALRSTVMADFAEVIKMPINEPAAGKKKSQIQEYVDYHGGAGVQHIALFVDNIIPAIQALRARGVEFLRTPRTYYEDVRRRLKVSPLNVKEDLDTLEQLGILIDFDDQGYLLQIFTKPVEDRPTLFYEVIQRRNHQGFGAGNFKSLFEAIERDQAERGNL
jgi:4-hydroxyphenylpyruvate dioxygenase